MNKIKKIVGFGDSWTYGDELVDPELLKQDKDAHTSWHQNNDYRTTNCFLGHLGRHYDVPVENYGIPGGSLQSAQWTFLWWLRQEPNPEQCLVLHGTTDNDRFTFYDPNHKHYGEDPAWNKFVHSTWIEYGSSTIPKHFREIGKALIAYSVCDELNEYNYEQALGLFDGKSARLNIPMLQFHIMPPLTPVDVPTLIWPERNYCHWIVNHPERKTLTAPLGHPNEIGHKKISKHLIPEIDSVILT